MRSWSDGWCYAGEVIVGQERQNEYARLTAAIEDAFRSLQGAMDTGDLALMRQQRSRLAALRDDLAAWRARGGSAVSAPVRAAAAASRSAGAGGLGGGQ